jgi:acetyl/propionyl-CoA carboxylase alpha subunit/acetyl-CoA carboxylase carboxyltransferase component
MNQVEKSELLRGRTLKRLLIANRGEIAGRIARTASDAGIETVAIFSEEDSNSLHTRLADRAVPLKAAGARAYLDIERIVSIASELGCDSIHPGYGFLSESASFAQRCIEAGLNFVGPTPEQLALLGDKARARNLARAAGVPLLPGTTGPATLAEARHILEQISPGGSIMLKAVAGGGGRGIRRVDRLADLDSAFERCRSEATRAFGNGELYVEQFLPHARHVEVQIVGDFQGAVSHLWDRECSLQRHNQKIVEIAPACGIADTVRARLFEAAIAIAHAVDYRGLGTVEFLVDETKPGAEHFFFLEVNPRLQVEHTVTEEVTGLDLVSVQLGIASGRSLAELGILRAEVMKPTGIAVQARVNMETMLPSGGTKPETGTITIYEPPAGPGVRVDGMGYSGYRANASFDSLLAKVIVHARSDELSDAMQKMGRALAEFRIVGVATNLPYLRRIVSMPEVREGRFDTGFLEDESEALVQTGGAMERTRFFEQPRPDRSANKADPLAIINYGVSQAHADGPAKSPEVVIPEGTAAVRAPLQGTVLVVNVSVGDPVGLGQQMFVLDAMKMEHLVLCAEPGIIHTLVVAENDVVSEGAVLAIVAPQEVNSSEAMLAQSEPVDHIRPGLAEVIERKDALTDEARPEPVERRHKSGQRTARENIADLCDPDSFMEMGGLTVAARRARHSLDELIRNTPADGFIMGTGRVNGTIFPDDRARCAVMSYDPTVMAGTQGFKGHEKLDRILELTHKFRLPIIFFTEGGGGRPGDTDKLGIGYNFIRTFALLGQMSGTAPLVGVNNGRCFGGNAFILGSCDVIIATKNSTIGFGGPAVIEGAGLGSYRAEEVGPASMHVANGVIDVLVDDERAAVAAAKQYLSYFQGPLSDWSAPDQRLLRSIVPENRRRVYSMIKLISILADTGSMLELRPSFGVGMHTALIRVEGRPLGVIANNPNHLGGAVDSAGADKAARFMQLCEAYDLPILALSDTPGNMIGPEAERTALIRHCARMTVIGSNLTVPWMTIVVRKGYGLGGLAMAGGSFSNCILTAAWPTGEFGGMPMEGYVKLGFRDELAAISDIEERKAKYEQMVAEMYDSGKALGAATFFEFDDVIDPVDTRKRIVEALRSAPQAPHRDGKRLRWIDTW